MPYPHERRPPLTTDSLFAALGTASCGAYAVSIDQTIVFWNRAAERILGYASDEVVGRRCYEVVAPGGLTPQCLGGCPSIRYLRAGLVPSTTQLRMTCSSGQRKWVSVTPMVVAGLLGDAPLLVHLFEDVADADDFGEAEASLRDALEEGGADILSDHPPAPATSGAVSALTGREVEVLRLVALGRDTARISQELGISQHTVRNHIRNLRHKLNATTKLDAVVEGIRLGILSVDRLR